MLETKIATLEQMLEGEVQVNFEATPEKKWRPLSRLALILPWSGSRSASAASCSTRSGSSRLGVVLPIVGAIIVLVGVGFGIAGWWRRRQDRVKEHLRDVEVDRRLRGRSDIEDELKTTQVELAADLEALDVELTAEAEARLRAEEAHVASIDERRARLTGLVGDEPRDRLPEVRDAAALEIERKTSALGALGPIAKEPRARERLEVEVHDAERQLERARDDEADARARVEQNPVDAEEVAGLAERLAGWSEELAALKRRERVYAMTLREINAAEQATMQRATRYLERRMVKDVARITDGRYRRVRVDDADLGIEVHSPEKDDWVPVTELSQGTLDVVYLAARLGLVRLVTGDRRPPLILDDPFVTLDDVRAARALELLKEVASDFQVIYLTTSDRYDPLADRVVELAGPTASDGHVEPEEPATA